MKPKTIKNLETDWLVSTKGKGKGWKFVNSTKLRQEAIKIFKNLQSPETIYPILLDKFPDSCKGEIAKDKWNDTIFKYGTEYGMLAMLFWLMNLTEEDLK